MTTTGVAALTLVGTGVTPGSAAAGDTTLTAEADAWVDSGNPSLNHGSTTYLQVDASPTLRAYLRFRVAVPTGQRVLKAVLRVTPNQSSSGGFSVRTASSSWTESGITWSNAPAPGSTTIASSTALTAGVVASVDVTSAVPSAGGAVTLAVDNSTSTSYSLQTRERSTGAPSLLLTLGSDTTASPGPTTSPSASTSPAPTTSPSATTGPALTTSPSPSSSPSPVARGAKLTWAPPALVNPVTYHVSGDGPGTINAPAGQDSIVVWDSPTHRRIRFSGGRHWVIRGGEVINDKQWSSLDDQAGIQFENVTGTAFVEGLYVHGPYGKDGIRVGSGGSGTTLVVQNSRILDRLSGPTVYHTDVIQPYGGIRALKVDRLTGTSDYQGQMWKQETGTTFGPTDFRRVNYRALSPEVQYMINLVMSYATQPVSLSEVYNQPAPAFVGGDFCRAQTPSGSATCATDANGRKYVTWSGTPITVTGRVTQGVPPGGDFVPEGVAGLRYQSPGYL